MVGERAGASCAQSCGNCYAVYEKAEDAGACPVAEGLMGAQRRGEPSVSGRAAWLLLRYAAGREFFTRPRAMQELFQSGELATDDPDTQRARFNAAFDRLEFVLGAGVVAVDKTVRPHIYTLVGPAVTEWCVANQSRGTTVEESVTASQGSTGEAQPETANEEVVIDKKQFKKLDVLPGLAQMTFSYIIPRAETPDPVLFEATVAQAIKNTGRKDLVRASLAQAAKKCVSDTNLRRYGRTPGAKERYAQVCRIRDRLV